MRKFVLLMVAVVSFAVVDLTQATTVIPPSFDELVAHAQVIFQGTVTNVSSQWTGEGASRTIVTYVTFKVDDALKGAPGDTYTIRMLGGTVDGETLEVTDSPKFNTGDRDILFVENNGSQFIPLVGIMHGRFHVQRDDQTGGEIVTTNERQPVKDVSLLSQGERMTNVAGHALSSTDFKNQIRTKLQNQSAQAQ